MNTTTTKKITDSNTASSAFVVNVVAPETLEVGYQFEAIHNGESFQVTVPKGGVTKGQTFQVPLTSNNINTHTKPYPPPPHDDDGKWNDHIFKCCIHGICHPSFRTAIIFPLCLLAQVMTRMNLTICGHPGTHKQVKWTFPFMISILLGLMILSYFATSAGAGSSPIVTMGCVFIEIFGFLLLVRTRRAVRNKYSIPDTTCFMVSNDFCYAFWFPCCTISQLARQTTLTTTKTTRMAADLSKTGFRKDAASASASASSRRNDPSRVMMVV